MRIKLIIICACAVLLLAQTANALNDKKKPDTWHKKETENAIFEEVDEQGKAAKAKVEECFTLTRKSATHPYLLKLYDELILNFSQSKLQWKDLEAVVSFKIFKYQEDCRYKDGHEECYLPLNFDEIPGRGDGETYGLTWMTEMFPGWMTVKKAGIRKSSGNEEFDEDALDAIEFIVDLPNIPNQYNDKCFEIKLPQ